MALDLFGSLSFIVDDVLCHGCGTDLPILNGVQDACCIREVVAVTAVNHFHHELSQDAVEVQAVVLVFLQELGIVQGLTFIVIVFLHDRLLSRTLEKLVELKLGFKQVEVYQNDTDVDCINKILLVVTDELLEEFGELSGVKQAENIVHVVGGVFSELGS